MKKVSLIFFTPGYSFYILQKNNADSQASIDPNYKRTNYHRAKGIGIIKREVTTGTSTKTDLLIRNG